MISLAPSGKASTRANDNILNGGGDCNGFDTFG